jgi:hypothetical protein
VSVEVEGGCLMDGMRGYNLLLGWVSQRFCQIEVIVS